MLVWMVFLLIGFVLIVGCAAVGVVLCGCYVFDWFVCLLRSCACGLLFD